ncbi:C40 family peptidase [Georgenia alba]|uniref:NlpC/P60 family protein n=1 Tax=Georgenia alba TaxID=2233858 RepID=A0ABW2QGH8_9MICO
MRRITAAFAALVVGGTLIPAAAFATPSQEDISSAREAERSTSQQIAALEIELASVAAQAEEARVRAQIANEQYLRAQVALDEAEARAEEAQAQADAAAEEVDAARTELGQIGAALYRDGSATLSGAMPYLSSHSFSEAMARQETLDRLGTRTDEQVQHFQALEQVHGTLQDRAEDAVAEQQEATDALAAASREAQSAARAAETQLTVSAERRQQLIAQLAEQRRTTVALEEERQEALESERRERERRAAEAAAEEQAAQEQAAQEQAAQEQAQREAGDRAAEEEQAPERSEPTRRPEPEPTREPAPEPTREPAPEPTREPAPEPEPEPAPEPEPEPAPEPEPEPAPAPPNTSAAQTAIAWARTQLGKPYIWAAAGPHGYDCSGLTMRAYEQAGIYLPRTSGAQYAASTPVPLSQLRAGDLVFWSSNGAASGIYHVGIYTGNGMRLHAPSPGSTVEEVPMWYGSILPYGGRVA